MPGRGGCDGDGDELFIEAAGGLRGNGFLVAREGEGILVVARDSVLAGNALGGEAHGEQRCGVVGGKPRIGAGLDAAHGNEAHGFGAAGHDDARAARADALIGQRDGLQAGGAEAIDGDAGDFDGQAGAQSGPAGDVPALLAFGLRAAEDYVVDGRFSTAGTRSRAPVSAVAARSSGRMVESAPLGARPTGVRTAATRTASGMGGSYEQGQQVSKSASRRLGVTRPMGMRTNDWPLTRC